MAHKEKWEQPVNNDHLDMEDLTILSDRYGLLVKRKPLVPHVGDFVRFADGTLRRVAHEWPDGVQTSDNGSFYLDIGGISMSGGLYRTVPTDTLKMTLEIRDGDVWFFHHDFPTTGGGVPAVLGFHVWACSEEATT
jgi:hypothetical protein